jgi:hypothetical protein
MQHTVPAAPSLYVIAPYLLTLQELSVKNIDLVTVPMMPWFKISMVTKIAILDSM